MSTARTSSVFENTQGQNISFFSEENVSKESPILCSRYDFEEVLDERRCKSLFITLREQNLGVEKMSKVRYGNRYKKNRSGAIRSIIFFDIDECIEQFKSIREKYRKNTDRKANSKVLSCHNRTIKDLEEIKRYKLQNL